MLYGLWAIGEIENNDLHILAKLLSDSDLHSLINYYDGGTLKIPTKKQRDDGFILAQMLYMKLGLNYTPKEIDKFYRDNNVDIKFKDYRYKLKKIQTKLNSDMQGIINDLPN